MCMSRRVTSFKLMKARCHFALKNHSLYRHKPGNNNVTWIFLMISMGHIKCHAIQTVTVYSLMEIVCLQIRLENPSACDL